MKNREIYREENEAVQEHGELVLGKQEVLEASRELWGKKRVETTSRGLGFLPALVPSRTSP